MKTKAQIVKELLDSKAITAEDAVVLLMNVEKEYIYVPMQAHVQWPSSPLQPSWRGFDVMCGTNEFKTSNNFTIN